MKFNDEWLNQKDKKKYKNTWNKERVLMYKTNGIISGKLGSLSEKDKKEYKLKLRKLDEKKNKS